MWNKIIKTMKHMINCSRFNRPVRLKIDNPIRRPWNAMSKPTVQMSSVRNTT